MRAEWIRARNEDQVMVSKIAGSVEVLYHKLVEFRDREAQMVIGQLTRENLVFLGLA